MPKTGLLGNPKNLKSIFEKAAEEFKKLEAKGQAAQVITITAPDPRKPRPGFIGIAADPVAIHYPDLTFDVVKIGEKLLAIKKTDCLGQGAFGKVYVGQDIDGNCFAIKIEKLSPYMQSITGSKTEDSDEIKVLKALHRYIGDIKTKVDRYMAVRLESGKTLSSALQTFVPSQNKNRSYIERLTIGLQAAYDINFLHSMNILHCDIKPDNFMSSIERDTLVGTQITVTSIDFGLSMKLEKDQTSRTNSNMGTPNYMAPEFEKHSFVADYSKATDIYALGKTFDEMKIAPVLCEKMTAEQPQERPSALKVLSALLTELKKHPISELDEATLGLINSCEIHLSNYFAKHPELGIPPLKSYKQEKLEALYEEFEKKFSVEETLSKTDHQKLIQFLKTQDKTITIDDKATVLKGCLILKLESLENSLNPFNKFTNKQRIKEIKQMITDINKLSGKARFIGNVSKKIYTQSIHPLDTAILTQSSLDSGHTLRKPLLEAPTPPKKPTSKKLK